MRALLIAAAVLGLGTLAGCAVEVKPVATSDPPVSTPTVTTPTPTGVPSVTKPQDPPGATPPATAPSPPVSIGPSGSVVPAGVTEVPAAQVDASALPEYYEHRGQVWVFDDGYSLQMFAMASSGCTDAEAMLVDQSATEVRIMLRPMDQPQGGPPDGTVCTEVLTPKPVVVALDAPLGSRTIYLAGGR